MTKPLSKTALFRADYNAKALARLNKALPEIFPRGVLVRAYARPYIPPMPRLAVDGYWRAHPLRADRLARALARKSGAPEGWTWRLTEKRKDGLPQTFRTPPAPYREKAFARGPGHCCVCGQPVYKLGWHKDLWGTGPSKTASWHSACVIAWRLWVAPSDFAPLLRKLQQRRCAGSGGRLWKTAEIDHRLPLFRVWREHRNLSWPDLLDHWGLPNLDVINRTVHVEKCATEAGYRAERRLLALASSE
ncbi:hypothetical protein GJW-30_1_00037 [Variibacter gotjawalensis]|uniref:Uncharacterized protein n=1 Tax=Variibacter gotjawalensis TaxID=1333996 RepID=A0A0S3PNT9_9BRAD|nr:hypothetical protein [Variibacter gotjawalensis]NIK47816.1 hypothetical protein [Variibacter gotjawalensis]RZS49703.1 hypothetical protein EV661_2142 [Variibacter gotjawalensis]BAT57532.1 hypothetical protein GJW-30_1_00037 [Variibacter gotjawalensis]